MTVIPKDMPKLESPFVREGKDYLVTPKINPGYEWVFDDPLTLATEKLDGTDVSIILEESAIVGVYNRTARIPSFNKGKQYITEGVLNSMQKDYTDLPDGQWFGEVIGPKLNGNPYRLDEHLWIPFKTYVEEHLAYKSWGKYPKTFAAISEWFKDGPISLFMLKRGVKDALAEGVVFHHPDGRMAKLRRDMFDFYQGSRHKQP